MATLLSIIAISLAVYTKMQLDNQLRQIEKERQLFEKQYKVMKQKYEAHERSENKNL